MESPKPAVLELAPGASLQPLRSRAAQTPATPLLIPTVVISLLHPQDLEIRDNAANYLPQISQLLSHVPRQMLLIFKTNDLLRGIEAALGTRASASSFLNMSRCCIRALAQ